MSVDVIRIMPLHYMHVKDTNTNIVKMVCDVPKYPLFQNLEGTIFPISIVLIFSCGEAYADGSHPTRPLLLRGESSD